jgi:hypothetical protein
MMEDYLSLFEEAIKIQSEQVGESQALAQAKRAGLSVSASGHIVSCTGNPALVLLRLIRTFTEDGNLNALKAIGPLIEKISELQEEWSRPVE